tara:strand:+ start:1341 stop:2387 length:1047 start_codon:yes stop_codon:yes gene_type:complete
MSNKKDIRLLSLNELILFCKENKLPTYRAKQIYEWLWKKNVKSFDDMSSISQKTRNMLKDVFWINNIKVYSQDISIDNTIKYGLRLHDQNIVEGVLIPSKKRITACISSQAGCSLSCNFCATGKLTLKRNLTSSEIYDQVFLLNEESKKYFEKPITNIVYMGMGEPLLNYKCLLESIDFITTKKGLNMSPKRITVSTVGIAKLIKKLGDDMVKFNLAISLHSAEDSKRSNLMPINNNINLNQLKEAVEYFYKKTKTRITYEYILLKNINDSINDAKKLLDFIKITPCKINLIEYNTVSDFEFEKSTNKKTDLFINFLEKHNVIVNLRKSKGKDINAACGQLANQNELR